MWKLTHKGSYVKIHGSPEFRVYELVDPEHGILFDILIHELGNVGKSGYEICLKEGYLEYNMENRKIFRKKEFTRDIIKFYLHEIDNGFILSKPIMNMLKKRNLIENNN